ncbi:MAG: epimerase [Anaerolineales bacterium]|nr:MAG: epimerase [Anaerolineales bacterium]
MRILILGGTRFIGRIFIEAALGRGHEITYFHRGQTEPGLFPACREIIGDRDGDLARLGDQTWDAVLDTSGYFPRLVHDSTRFLSPRIGHYIFVSTISVYADFKEPGMREDAPLGQLEDASVEQVNETTYGPLKVLCEQAVERSYPDNALIIRPGIIVGPHDSTDRFTYWVRRGARGGEILAPAPPGQSVQIIDVRDLMGWTLNLIETGITGIFNATGPIESLTLGEMLDACIAHAEQPAHLTWIDEPFLTDQEVQPSMLFPLWAPGAEHAGMFSVDGSKAFAAGLTPRPLQETVRATLEWDRSRDPFAVFKAGLAFERETQLLNRWKQRLK